MSVPILKGGTGEKGTVHCYDPGMLFQYPYPRQLRHWLIGLFAVAMATLATGLLALIAKRSGVDISEADMLRWFIPSFGISFLALGALLVRLAAQVRRHKRDS